MKRNTKTKAVTVVQHIPFKMIIGLLFAMLLMLITVQSARGDIPVYKDDDRISQPHAYSAVTIQVIDDRGRVFKSFDANSNNYKHLRHYLQAKKGKKYQLRVKNNSNKRVGLVIAVDGINILTGKKSYLKSNERMYVLNPYQSSTYQGWRTQKNYVNRFYFTNANNSYANAWGDKSAMGVIAVAVYNEVPRHHHHYEGKAKVTPYSSSARRSLSADESTGTGFGYREYSPTQVTQFKAQHRPLVKHFYKYEWKTTLCQKGVIHCGHDYNKPRNRFWPEHVNSGYAPYPPKYVHSHAYKNNYKNKNWSDQFTRNWNETYERGW